MWKVKEWKEKEHQRAIFKKKEMVAKEQKD